MLVLTRHAGQSLMIGNNVKVKVLSVKGQQVRIGIDAPQYIPVHRQEIYERVKNIKLKPEAVGLDEFKEQIEQAQQNPEQWEEGVPEVITGVSSWERVTE